MYKMPSSFNGEFNMIIIQQLSKKGGLKESSVTKQP